LHPARNNCTFCADDEDIPAQKPEQLLSLLTIQLARRASEVVDQMQIPLEHPKWTRIQSLSSSEVDPDPVSFAPPLPVHISFTSTAPMLCAACEAHSPFDEHVLRSCFS